MEQIVLNGVGKKTRLGFLKGQVFESVLWPCIVRTRKNLLMFSSMCSFYTK